MHPTHLILSPGTRIVTRNDTNPIGGGALIPTGAVGVIIDSPSDAQHAYKIRLNDGREAILPRAEFSIINDISEQMPPQGQLVLDPAQKALHDALALKGEGLAQMYFGGVCALNSPGNPERYSQCAQSFRELMEKLWIEYDASLKKKGTGLKAKTRALEATWRKIRSKDGKTVAVTQMVTASLEKFCVELDNFFEWNRRFLPNRREQVSRLIAQIDPMSGKLPKIIMRLRVDEYAALRDYFEDVAHHNVQPASDAEFRSYVEVFEKFLLDRLRPRTAESFSKIQRLIQEGESSA